MARKRAREQLKPKTPEPVEGRKHIDVQTELYLEELTDRVEEADVYTQTDAFLDRPPSPLYIPAKTGVDVATQILEGEVMCNKCIVLASRFILKRVYIMKISNSQGYCRFVKSQMSL